MVLDSTHNLNTFLFLRTFSYISNCLGVTETQISNKQNFMCFRRSVFCI